MWIVNLNHRRWIRWNLSSLHVSALLRTLFKPNHKVVQDHHYSSQLMQSSKPKYCIRRAGISVFHIRPNLSIQHQFQPLICAHPNYSSRMILRMGVDVPLVLMCLIPSDVWLAPPFVPPPSKTCKTTSYSSAPLNWASKVDLAHANEFSWHAEICIFNDSLLYMDDKALLFSHVITEQINKKLLKIIEDCKHRKHHW